MALALLVTIMPTISLTRECLEVAFGFGWIT